MLSSATLHLRFTRFLRIVITSIVRLIVILTRSLTTVVDVRAVTQTPPSPRLKTIILKQLNHSYLYS